MEQAIQGARAKGGAACPPAGRRREMFLKRATKCAFRYGRQELKLLMVAAPIRETDVVWAAGRAEIVLNANHGGAASIPKRWEAAPPCDGHPELSPTNIRGVPPGRDTRI